jgi:hypothetical protein
VSEGYRAAIVESAASDIVYLILRWKTSEFIPVMKGAEGAAVLGSAGLVFCLIASGASASSLSICAGRSRAEPPFIAQIM